jgi:predicted dehydrogenase
MKILVVGVGSIGKRHLGLLLDMGFRDIVVCDAQKTRLDEVQNIYPGLREFQDYTTAFKEDLDVVFICTPPHLHTNILAKAVDNGCHVFCEKPLAMNLEGLNEIERRAREKNLVVMIGYVYRFCKPIKKIKEIIDSKILGKIYSARTIISLYLPDWHPWEDYREFFLSHRDLGGGALLEESHATDYIKWMMGDVKAVGCINKKLSNLELDAEDMTIINLEFQNGSLGAIQIDLLGRVLRKEAEFIGEKGTVLWDAERGLVRLFTAARGEWEEFELAFTPDAYVDQLNHFFECIRDHKEPITALHDAIETLRICVAAFKSDAERRMVELKEISEDTKVIRPDYQ